MMPQERIYEWQWTDTTDAGRSHDNDNIDSHSQTFRLAAEILDPIASFIDIVMVSVREHVMLWKCNVIDFPLCYNSWMYFKESMP